MKLTSARHGKVPVLLHDPIFQDSSTVF